MSSTVLDPKLTGTYALDASHSRLGFSARHAMVTKVRGQFKEYEGSGFLDFDDPAKSTASVTVQVASVDTGNEQRDGHLSTNDFFDAPTYPTITFTSTGAAKVDDENFTLTGDLTIKDVTKSVTIDFEFTGTSVDPFNNTRVGFEGKTVVNRKDWGINFNAALETGGVLVSDKVTLEFDISAIRQDS
ncbi:YceI family protein [Phytomonospora endophytica]|uniref:Polyisoprenoid-binding protein YceI n=1 Tax=Phytomonospora endophytica TaxID=714109 RepID=A0A841G1Y1_9ACTN|nr:YceI family protein [Phytomonospora endophytica]MBB6038160.1 polyisoprenoid-binding protein YceI [Phytomonospora endophytica]GIG67377.1 polyisoprenoid-binding protein [Phytomonospora endophytica]